jgi:hypothetical protein
MLSGERDHWISHWNREGGPLDIIAIAVAVIVIVGGVVIFNSASKEYTMANRAPVTSEVPVLTPSTVPVPNQAPKQ